MARSIPAIEVTDEDQKYITETIQPYRKYAGENPELLSILYDIDLLPEQIFLPVNALRMVVFCKLFEELELYKLGFEAEEDKK